MATTKTVNVTVANSAGETHTFKLDNPTASISLAGVESAFKELLDSGVFVTAAGRPYSTVKGAEVVETTTTPLT